MRSCKTRMRSSLIETHKDKFQVKPIEIITTKNNTKYVVTKDALCVFLNRKTKKCEIYEHREEVCRIYGISKDLRLQCPYFKPSGRRRSKASEKKMLKLIDKMLKQLKETRELK